MRIGNLLKRSREEKRLTQQQVAKKFHVTRQTVSRWENDLSYPNIDTLVELSFFFDFSLDQILKGEELAGSIIDEQQDENFSG
ncbi:transcriptional regulator [Enterococcus ureilyticus]|uniref:Transcriptional regulator n=1 Tax=Enterococcus ureilyticus TaxID=1131292 RepID=A0A1E5HAW6_9ENTE|nr:helix-turn-helix transcriptional regulator [Enterococcus ureilyticus]MBM7690266.1 transcriptional regulator with XRE-family HTH domain [Enterococcus ureilyticus]MBO0447673.1 helix-turn-helix transcriptional regulator [Enterococcus ureilyticus]OEG22091.1 transcriptional regulator [Enterococcus ureilyticus]